MPPTEKAKLQSISAQLIEEATRNEAVLSEQQKQAILARCNQPGNPPGLKELCEICFGPGVDGRDKRAKLIREFCGSMNKQFRLSYEYNKQSDGLIFSDDQQKFIKNHALQLTATEIARHLWSDPTIVNLDHRARAVKRFIETQADLVPSRINDDIPNDDYEPPRTIGSARTLVNEYIKDAITEEQLEKDTRIRKNLECLVRFMHNVRYLNLMRGFDTKGDRLMFENCFVRYLYNCGDDVTEIDVDSYISLCLEVVNRTNLQRELEKLNRMRDESLNEDKRLSMSIVEMIGKIHAAIDDTEKRQNQLRNNLEGTRSKRTELKLQNSQSVAQLVEAWRQEEKRKRMNKISDNRREMLTKEVDRLSNLDAIKVEIFGLDPEAF